MVDVDEQVVAAEGSPGVIKLTSSRLSRSLMPHLMHVCQSVTRIILSLKTYDKNVRQV